MQLSTHFTLEELTRTSTGLPNDPEPGAGANLVRLADTLLEPLRDLAGCPLRVNSGYRSGAVNAHVGGARRSAHMEGRAADVRPAEGTCAELFERARHSGLPFDQLILEPAWIHIAVARQGEQPRRQVLQAYLEDGQMRYRLVSHG